MRTLLEVDVGFRCWKISTRKFPTAFLQSRRRSSHANAVYAFVHSQIVSPTRPQLLPSHSQPSQPRHVSQPFPAAGAALVAFRCWLGWLWPAFGCLGPPLAREPDGAYAFYLQGYYYYYYLFFSFGITLSLSLMLFVVSFVWSWRVVLIYCYALERNAKDMKWMASIFHRSRRFGPHSKSKDFIFLRAFFFAFFSDGYLAERGKKIYHQGYNAKSKWTLTFFHFSHGCFSFLFFFSCKVLFIYLLVFSYCM